MMPIKRVKQIRKYIELACYPLCFKITDAGMLIYDISNGYYKDDENYLYYPDQDIYGYL